MARSANEVASGLVGPVCAKLGQHIEMIAAIIIFSIVVFIFLLRCFLVCCGFSEIEWLCYFFKRKNFIGPLIGFVTVYFPLTIAGKTEFEVQFVGGRLVAYSIVKPDTLVGQVSTKLLPCFNMLRVGRFAPVPE